VHNRRPVLAVAAILVLSGCTGVDAEGELVADTSRLTVVPEPAAPDRPPGSPAQADPAPPDPAPPDPAAPRPASPAPGAVEEAAQEEAARAAAADAASPMAVACAEVVEALSDAVVSYEVVALAEGGGSGDRTTAATEMRAAWEQARAAADRGGGGLPAAAAPAMAAVTGLHDGLATRATLDESDADAWRDAKEALQDWCAAQG
jgi:hypothetical protein